MAQHRQYGAAVKGRIYVSSRTSTSKNRVLAYEKGSIYGYSAEPVLLSLAAANRLISNFGIGASALTNIDERRSSLMAYGLSTEATEPWLRDEFLAELMGNDTYQLCANI